MDAKQLIEDLKTAVYEQDHELNTSKAALALLQELSPELYEQIMEKLNLI